MTTEYKNLLEDLHYYYEIDLDNCNMTNKDWINELTLLMTNPEYKNEIFKEIKEYKKDRNNLTITKGDFIEWYFNTGQDKELKELRLDLADDIIKILYDKDTATISIQDIFNQCNKEAIPLSYCEQYYNEDTDDCIGSLDNNYTLTLI